MEVCAVWLARDFLRTAGRPIDIPPCQHPTDLCPPITEGAPMTTTDAQLEAIARTDIREVINSNCLDTSIQSEVLYDEFPDEFNSDEEDAAKELIERYDAIVRRIRDEHFPAA